MAEKMVFMKEQEVIESVETITGADNVELGFSEEWELDTVRFDVSRNNAIVDKFIASLSKDTKFSQVDETVEVPVTAFIPDFSNLLDIELENRFDVCECNLFEDSILYSFWIA